MFGIAVACAAVAAGSFVVALPYLPFANADARRDTETVPRVIAYSGTIERDGNAVSVVVPMRFTLSNQGGTPIWSEERSALPSRTCSGVADCAVQVYSGSFSVMLGQYAPLTAVVLDAEDVYLSIAVHDGTDWVDLRGRQQITPTPYALWSLSGTDMSIGGDLAVAQTLDVDGSVDVLGAASLRGGATINGGATVNGAATMNNGATINDGLTVNGNTRLNNELTVSGSTSLAAMSASGITTLANQLRADGGTRLRGLVTMETADLSFANIAGRGDGRALVAESSDQLIVNYGGDFSGGTQIQSALRVTGALTAPAGITYTQQTNDSTSTVAMMPRYHMRLSFGGVGNATREIPLAILDSHCGDSDGCEMRIAMRYWGSNANAGSASRSFLFYYDPSNGYFRTSTDAEGISGNNSLTHAYDLFGQCFLTDTTYSDGVQGVDADRRMHLLQWRGYSGAGRECNLTITD